MLNIYLTPEIPEPDKFDHETFTEICHYANDLDVKFIFTEDDLVTQENWKKFLKGIEEDPEKESGHLQAFWADGPVRLAARMDVLPKNSLSFLELCCGNPKQMYRKLFSETGKFEQIESVGAFLDELHPYSSSVRSMTIYDKYLIRFEKNFIDKKTKIHKPSLNQLSLICRALMNGPIPPTKITIITEFAAKYEIMKSKKVKSLHDPKVSAYFDDPGYKNRTKEIVTATIDALREDFPALYRTTFEIYDCSNPTLTKSGKTMQHDRFIGFANQNSLISSAGFTFSLDDVKTILNDPVKLKKKNLTNSTYIVPVTSNHIVPQRAHKITIRDE